MRRIEDVSQSVRIKSCQKEVYTVENKDFMEGKCGEVESAPIPGEDGERSTHTVIELFDGNGKRLLFELVDTFDFRNGEYLLFTPYFEGEEGDEPSGEPADVFVAKKLESKDGEPVLEFIEDAGVLHAVYDLFKTKNRDEFEFRE